MNNIYDYIFVVLTYKNCEDITSFIKSVDEKIVEPYKIIIVNSYYDEKSKNALENIALKNRCDFVNIENKGYGYGNNRGIEYAQNKYEFKYIIISNPDIEIKKFEKLDYNVFSEAIVGPNINTLNGKKQNPYYYKNVKIVEKMLYYSYISKSKVLCYTSIIINKIHRELMVFVNKILRNDIFQVYAVHGSFLIIGRQALDKIGQLYNEEIFLFAEENHLARLAEEKKIKSYIYNNINVLHKEDGSVGPKNEQIEKIARESFIKYYDSWK